MALMPMMSTAMSGLTAMQVKLETTADNLANVDTTGFKSSRTDFQTLFSETLRSGTEPTGDLGGVDPLQIGTGVEVAGFTVDFSQGGVTSTGREGDAAIQGGGFFILQDAFGVPAYTRDGAFAVNLAGTLVDPATGWPVLGVNADLSSFTLPAGGTLQPLQVPIGQTLATGPGTTATLTGFRLESDGTVTGIFDDGVDRTLGLVRLARFLSPDGLEAAGGTVFRETGASGRPILGVPGSPGLGSLADRSLEASNVDETEQLGELIDAHRAFHGNSAVLSRAEDLLAALLDVVKQGSRSGR